MSKKVVFKTYHQDQLSLLPPSGAFSTVFWIDPSNKLIVIQLRQVLQSRYNNQINSQLEKIVYSAMDD